MVSKRFLGAVASAGFSTHVVAQNLTGLPGCDALIAAGLSDILVFPGEDLYQTSVSTYYSGDNRLLSPYCIVQPRSTAQVASVVTALASANPGGDWEIAVRSGGHSDYDNNAVQRGVDIDLSYFNSTTLVNNNNTVQWNGTSTLTPAVAQIRPAARWGDVYTWLEGYNLAVTGGRSAHVGAGGLLVSGGASYHTQLWGLACDNVINYEVVLSNGSVVYANADENADLFKALKGGGSNLGIVTRFDLRTFTIPPTGVYGGLVFTTWDYLDVVVDQFAAYASGIASSSPDHQFTVFRYQEGGIYDIMSMVVSTDGNTNSSVFEPFNTIPLTIDIRTTLPMSTIAETITDLGGSYYISYTLTIQPTTDVLQKAADIFLGLTQTLNSTGVPCGINFIVQPLPKMLASVNPGGNILGFDESLVTDQVLFEARATLDPGNEGYEGVVQTLMSKTKVDLQTYAQSQPGYSSYLYMNYAAPDQDVIGSYGTDNVAYLRSTAATYDPAGFFQYRVPGGWKVSRTE
ncbi:FAD binding domain-containing protein [Xylariales sp. PMI_506]|nr:FAD binding domain-containing protein [Xylariales sp. PMI_506]